jgi:hypothetical protein
MSPTYTTAMPRIMDGIVTLMRARTGYRSPTSTSATGIVVYDSLEVLLQNDSPASQYIVIGQNAMDDFSDGISGVMMGESGQTEGPFGTNRPRDERGIIQGNCVCQLGEGDQNASVKLARDRAFAMLADIELVLRADPTVNGAVGNLWAFNTQQYTKTYLNEGIVCDVGWIIYYRARL